MSAGVYKPQHKTNGLQSVGVDQILPNKGIEVWDKARATGKSLGHVEDKVTKEHTNKKAQVGKRFHEGGDYNKRRSASEQRG